MVITTNGATSVTGVDLGSPSATDNCGIAAVYNDAPLTYYAGTTTVTWTCEDMHGNVVYAYQDVTINVPVGNHAPAISSMTTSDPDNLILMGSSITLNVNWTDEAAGGPYAVDIDWKDGSSHSVFTGISANSKSATHTYAKTGVFNPVVKVTDGGSLATTAIFKYIVSYVNSTYSTTASGTFTAPAGSYPAKPNLSANNRRVEFANHCKQKGNTPGVFDGDLTLEMEGAHFEFETEDIDWDYLAVSGCYLAEFRGTGYLYDDGHSGGCHGGCHNSCNYGHANQNTTFGILVVQSDKTRNASNKNKIRIKIWNKNTNAVIFDTQMGDDDFALPTTTICSDNTIKVKVPNSCVPRLINPTYTNQPEETENTTLATAADFSVEVFPNPFVNAATVKVNSASTDNVTITVYNVVGKLVQVIASAKANEAISLDNTLPTGAYFVHVNQGSNTQVIKIVKNAE